MTNLSPDDTAILKQLLANASMAPELGTIDDKRLQLLAREGYVMRVLLVSHTTYYLSEKGKRVLEERDDR